MMESSPTAAVDAKAAPPAPKKPEESAASQTRVRVDIEGWGEAGFADYRRLPGASQAGHTKSGGGSLGGRGEGAGQTGPRTRQRAARARRRRSPRGPWPGSWAWAAGRRRSRRRSPRSAPPTASLLREMRQTERLGAWPALHASSIAGIAKTFDECIVSSRARPWRQTLESRQEDGRMCSTH